METQILIFVFSNKYLWKSMIIFEGLVVTVQKLKWLQKLFDKFNSFDVKIIIACSVRIEFSQNRANDGKFNMAEYLKLFCVHSIELIILET